MIKRRGYGNIVGKTMIYIENITDTGYKIYPGKIFEYEYLDVKEEHGSVIVAICFISYFYLHYKNSYNKKVKTRKTHKTIKNNK
jgi:hypothetical protein